MRIGLDIRWLHQTLSHQPAEECPGGIGSYSLHLTKHLLRFDDENRYVLFGSRAFPIELLTKHFPEDGKSTIVLLPVSPAVNVAQATLGVVFKRLWERANIAPVLRAQHLDVMHFHQQGEIPHLGPYKTMMTVHDMMLSVYDRQFFGNAVSRWLWRRHVRNFRAADAIIAISESTKRDIIAYADVRPDQIHMIYYGLAGTFKG
ncbi:MAG: glycosyltransferase, partial [Candidatus Edwardsbacteria bacterium]|nr:glycosyltransferase [Candidatus Edwardsbacteria bacterium]